MGASAHNSLRFRASRRVALQLGGSLFLAAIATLYPAWTILVATVPVAAIVSIAIARDEWHSLCLRCGWTILLLGIGGLATNGESGGYGAVAATVPIALTMLLFALASALPPQEVRSVRWAAVSGCLSAGVAELLILTAGAQALFHGTDGAAAVPFAMLLAGAPALILVVRLAIPWPDHHARALQIAAAIAFAAALLCTLLFNAAPIDHAALTLVEAGCDAAALVFTMQCILSVAHDIAAVAEM